MRVVSDPLLIISGVYLALGLIYLRFWWTERARRDYLAFTLSSISVALFSWGELGMMRSLTPEDYLFYAWWNFLTGVLVTLSIAWFAFIHLEGRRWLFLTYCALRLSGVVVHLIMPNGINFREVTSVGRVDVFGEVLSYPIAVPNPWMILPHLSHVLLIIFCVDASIRTWRRGDHRKAWVIGTGVVLYRIIVSTTSVGVLWGLVQLPFLVSFSIIFVIAAMLYELNYEMHSAAMLAEKLEEREAELKHSLYNINVSANAANVGLWSKNLGDDSVWVTQKTRELWGFSDSTPSMMAEYAKRVHADDLEQFSRIIIEAEEKETDFRVEYRIVQPDRSLRWVVSVGRVELVNEHAKALRGATVDITQRKLAEEAVHELSRRLMGSQEEERSRLARELHDDLSQSLALLSIQMSVLNDGPDDASYIKEQVQHLVSEVAQVAAQVRRISHELHPAKLNQLGLEAALHGLCREIDAAYPLKVKFEAENLPRKLPDDLSLCLYRVAQESLQNIIKHSGADTAHIAIKLVNHRAHLSVSDNGKGFDVNSVNGKKSLGLISINERVRAVDGTLKINSTIGAGTKIEVSAPLNSNI